MSQSKVTRILIDGKPRTVPVNDGAFIATAPTQIIERRSAVVTRVDGCGWRIERFLDEPDGLDAIVAEGRRACAEIEDAIARLRARLGKRR